MAKSKHPKGRTLKRHHMGGYGFDIWTWCGDTFGP